MNGITPKEPKINEMTNSTSQNMMVFLGGTAALCHPYLIAT